MAPETDDIVEQKKRDKARKRLYSLYPEQIQKLEKLAEHSGISQSAYLRELIDVEYVRKFYKSRYGGAD